MILPPFNDNYMAEMKSADVTAAAERAFSMGLRRIVLVFDATSPLEVLRRFIWSCNRKRQRIYRRDWLDSTVGGALQIHGIRDGGISVANLTRSQAPSNEWADVGADEAVESWGVDDVAIEPVMYS